jgi:hypothetical protein
MQTKEEILKGYEGKYKDIWDFEFSPDWKGYIFIAQKDNKKWVAVINWKESKEYKYIWNFKYSPDWKGYAFKVRKENWKWVLVINWIESDEYDDIEEFEYLKDWKISFIGKKEIIL